MKFLLLMASIVLASCSSPKAYKSPQQCLEVIATTKQKAISFLLDKQYPTGAWGNATKTKGLNIYAPGATAHIDFQTAVTALCMMALSKEDTSPAIHKSLERATRYMLKSIPKVTRADGQWVGNIWSHAYIIRGLLKVRPIFPKMRSGIDAAINNQLKKLKTFSYRKGGWGYYDFSDPGKLKISTRKPSGSSTSFITGTCLIALAEAKEAGFAVPMTTVKGALANLIKQRNPDETFLYSEDHWIAPKNKISKKAGSVGRTPNGLLALYNWQADKVGKDKLNLAIDRLIRFDRWIDIGRKKPRPHESFFAIAGYFYYYAHYYGSQCLEHSNGDTQSQAMKLAWMIVNKQEKNGSWFDFPLYNYGDYYGTAFALMSLQAYEDTLLKKSPTNNK